MINVLVVEDSQVAREFLVRILSTDPAITVVATASNGEDALQMLRIRQPDVIVMDIYMPVMDGLEATRRIMQTKPIPIVIVSSSVTTTDSETAFDAIEAGALAVLRRPAGIGHPEHEAMAREMVQTVKLLSEVKTVRRWSRRGPATVPVPGVPADPGCPPTRLVAIGASTGGPSALETILAMLPKDFPVPVLIVQHMSSGFMEGFVRWLGNSSRLPVRLARHGEFPLPGNVYVAPDEYQMKIGPDEGIVLVKDQPEHGSRPSVSYLFRALAQVCGGNCAAGLLTGMGRDGVSELRILKENGAMTFAQDKETSVVHGMPGEAIKANAARLILPLGEIAPTLARLVNREGEITHDI